jgi:hypothetical protein
LYEDDGETLAYQRGESAATTMTYVRRGSRVAITIGPTAGRFSGQPASRTVVIELPDLKPASSAKVNAMTVRTDYRQSDHAVLISTEADIRRKVTITVVAAPLSTADIATAQALRRMSEVEGVPISGSINDAVAHASTIDEPVRSAALACAGIGSFDHNQAPYLFNGKIVNEVYGAAGLIAEKK